MTGPSPARRSGDPLLLVPPDHRHYLDDAGYERHLASRTHPDETDLAEAIAFLDRILADSVLPDKE